MDELLRSRRLAQEILQRAQSIQQHLDSVNASIQNMQMIEEQSSKQVRELLSFQFSGFHVWKTALVMANQLQGIPVSLFQYGVTAVLCMDNTDVQSRCNVARTAV